MAHDRCSERNDRQREGERERELKMRTLELMLITLLLFTASQANEAEVLGWTCGYRGLCRRHCNAQEYMIGYHGCPRRYRCCALRY
ncbi:hypothetical protein DNTS_006346 [Danionella cerebrum]|uniref:Beta-defensin n=1 Tax=Danionella cerebrum TaxID=2873325 RepID=A0A553Q5D4_9TELE|nr:hypothetical protein DNTS_006346 [Danionella translucida]